MVKHRKKKNSKDLFENQQKKKNDDISNELDDVNNESEFSEVKKTSEEYKLEQIKKEKDDFIKFNIFFNLSATLLGMIVFNWITKFQYGLEGFLGSLIGFSMVTLFCQVWVHTKSLQESFKQIIPFLIPIISAFAFERFFFNTPLGIIITFSVILLTMESYFWFVDKSVPEDNENVMLFTAYRKLVNFSKALIHILPILGFLNLAYDVGLVIEKNIQFVKNILNVVVPIVLGSAIIVMIVYLFLYLNSLKYRKKKIVKIKTDDLSEFDWISKRQKELKEELDKEAEDRIVGKKEEE